VVATNATIGRDFNMAVSPFIMLPESTAIQTRSGFA
jgi:hypothetical protein